MKNQNKNTRLTVRLTPEQYDSIRARAETAQMTPSAYVRAAAVRHKVVVVDGLKEMSHELKGLGRNLNQLVALVNCLVNADYYGRQGLVIIKKRDSITMANPGGTQIDRKQLEELQEKREAHGLKGSVYEEYRGLTMSM